MSQSDRIKNFLKQKKVKQNELAVFLGLGTTKLNTLINSEPFDEDFSEVLRKHLKIGKEEWRIILEGEPDPRDKEIAYLKRINELQENEIARLKDENLRLQNTIAMQEQNSK